MATTAYFHGFIEFKAPISCTIDSTQPTFSGISSVVPNNDGSFTINWASATSTKNPVRYEVYAALGNVNAATLFVQTNRVSIAPSSLNSYKVFVLRDQTTYFINGQLYTFGIRAVDSQNYSDSNTVVLTSTAIASGNIGGTFQATELLLANDHINFQNDHANFQSDHSNISATEILLASDETNINASAASLVTSSSSVASSAAILDTIASSATISGGLSLELSTPDLDMEVALDEELV